MKTIRVTADNIANGKPRSYCDCPIALATLDATGEPWFVAGGQVVCVNGWLILALPEVARQFIADFDAGRPVEPFEFELRL